MKICVVGAGAMGGLLGARMAEQGHQVSLVARGPHLDAIVEKGLNLHRNGEWTCARNAINRYQRYR